MDYGYVALDSADRSADNYLREIKKWVLGANQIFVDRLDSVCHPRPELTRCISKLETGDAVYTPGITHLGHRLKSVLLVIQQVLEKNSTLCLCKHQGIFLDSKSEVSLLDFIHTIGFWERELVAVRGNDNLRKARKRGTKGGRKSLSPTDEKVKLAMALYEHADLSIGDICGELHVSRSTFYRYLRLGSSQRQNNAREIG